MQEFQCLMKEFWFWTAKCLKCEFWNWILKYLEFLLSNSKIFKFCSKLLDFLFKFPRKVNFSTANRSVLLKILFLNVANLRNFEFVEIVTEFSREILAIFFWWESPKSPANRHFSCPSLFFTHEIKLNSLDKKKNCIVCEEEEEKSLKVAKSKFCR